MTVQDIAALIERTAPLHWQEEYDNAGLQVGSPATEVTGVLVSLDLTEAVIDEAVRRGCNLVVSHHPLIFRPLRQVCGLSWQQRCVEKALKAGVCLYSAHTNLDNAPDGVNRRIAEIIGLKGLRSLEEKADGSWSGAIGTLREIVEGTLRRRRPAVLRGRRDARPEGRLVRRGRQFSARYGKRKGSRLLYHRRAPLSRLVRGRRDAAGAAGAL